MWPFDTERVGDGEAMRKSVAHRMRCPSCGSWAQLRVAYPITEASGRAPVVVLYSCLGETSEGHIRPTDAELLTLVADAVPSG